MEVDHKKEVINICLDHLIKKGLSETSTRSLSAALKLQNAGLYYYFSSKDEAIIQCAEEAARRLEVALVPPAIRDMCDPDLMMKRLQTKAEEMAPTMKFLVSVCTSKRYQEKMKPVLSGLAKRYDYYANNVAEELHCEKEVVEPYVYMMIIAMVNYMIFAEDAFIAPQAKLAKGVIRRLTGQL